MDADLPRIEDLWDFGDLPATEAKFSELMKSIDRQMQADYYYQLVTQHARIKGLQGKFKEGHVLLEDIDLSISSNQTMVRYYLELGRLYNSNMEKDKAREKFVVAWEMARDAGLHYLAVDAAHMMGIAENDPEEQISWNIKAMEYAEQSGDTSAQHWLGALYNNTGWSLFDMGKLDEALELFERALQWREEKGDQKTIRIAKWSIARVYREMKRYDEALDIQLTLLQEYQEDGVPVSGYTLEELAELYYSKGDLQKAKQYFSRAYESLSQDPWLRKNEAERLDRLKQMAT